MAIRQAELTDVDAIVSLNVAEYWEDHSVWQQSSQSKRFAKAIWWGDHELYSWYLTNLQRTGGGVLLLVDAGQILATLEYCLSYDYIGDFRGSRAHIIWLLVHPQHRRKGYARQLIHQLRSELTVPIWVEPEDIRSEQLYESLGSRRYTISNWQLNINQISDFLLDSRLPYTVNPLSQLEHLSSTYSLIIGRYYAPAYDLEQFLHSTVVEQYMWGNTAIPDVHHYEFGSTNVYAVMTQYPRIWVNQDYQTSELKRILGSISLHLFEMGFDNLYLQVYNESNLNSMLRQLGYQCEIEADPVYAIE